MLSVLPGPIMPLVQRIYQLHTLRSRRPRYPLSAVSHISSGTRRQSMATGSLSRDHLQVLQNYTACDISDALLKLKVPNAGFLPDLTLFAPPSVSSPSQITIAPASTVIFSPKASTDTSSYPPANFPAGKHWVDLTHPDTIVVISQPEGQKNAVLGGIMALRMKVLSAQGVIVSGRVRDVAELRSTDLPIWARATSTVGSGADSKPHAAQVPLNIDGTIVNPGDIVFSDPENGVVVIPQNKLSEVISMLPRLVKADDLVKEDVIKGMSVQDAFKKHRGP